MRAGWMRPSWSSFSSVRRAISRRTPSKPDRITAPGVSSMMKSIARERLERADVAPLAADDAALQIVGLERDHRDGGLHRVARRHPLHHRGEDAAGAAVGVPLGLLLHLAHEAGAVVAQLVLDLLQKDLPRLARAQAGHPLELAHVLLPRCLQLLGLAVQVARAVLERLLLASELRQAQVERLLLAEQALLDARDLGPSCRQLDLAARSPTPSSLGSLSRVAIRGPTGARRSVRVLIVRATTAAATTAATTAASRISMSWCLSVAARATRRPHR